MKKFCRECGKELKGDNQFCKHCGTPITQDVAPEQASNKASATNQSNTPVKKPPMTKKNKIMWGAIIGALIILFSLHAWANSHFSQESVLKRYEEAVLKKDTTKLSKLLIREDGSPISDQEITAFLALIKENKIEYVNGLRSIVYDGKFLGIYDTYKVEVIDQYASYTDYVDGLSFTFNGEDFPVAEEDEQRIIYGPLAPGIYKVDAEFSGDHGETTKEGKVTLDNSYRDVVSIDMDLPISMVTFYVENHHQFNVSKAYITLNEEEIPLTQEGGTDEFGPFIIDGSQHINVTVDMPWGKITSEEIALDEPNMMINAELITPKQYDAIVETVTEFGEEYLHALAEESVKPLKMTTRALNEEIERQFGRSHHYSAKLVTTEIDKESMTVNQTKETPEVNLRVNYNLEADRHQIDEKPALKERGSPWLLSLTYNQKDEVWLVDKMEDLWGWNYDGSFDVKEGSNTLYGANKKDAQEAEKKDKAETANYTDAAIEERIKNYTVANIAAINNRDFSDVEPYLTKNGPRNKEADNYIDYLESKDIYENFHNVKLEKTEKIDDTTWKATYIEEIEIIKPDSAETKKFRTVIQLKLIDNEFYIDELISTNGI